ncbi:MAG: hypothetical protein CL608_02075 [Anaerolineaceae bacterium]|nr:hypothetical protein [Anaerolineaceae bacterium]
MHKEHELTIPIDLCLPNGRLNPTAVGWSRHPLHRCNLNGRWPRKKRWNYWAVTTESHLFSATISHLYYAGLVFVYYADFATGQFNEVTRLLPLGLGCQLTDVVAADANYGGRGLCVAMRQTKGGVDLAVESEISRLFFLGSRVLPASILVGASGRATAAGIGVALQDGKTAVSSA